MVSVRRLSHGDVVRALLASNPLRLILVNDPAVPKWHTQGLRFARALIFATTEAWTHLHEECAE
jgi:hypothetical protein